VFWQWNQYRYGRFYYMYFYNDQGGYAYRYYYQGGYAMSRGWWGIYYDLDINNVGRGYNYNFNDFSGVTQFQVYMYGYREPVWMDCAYFDKTPRGDNITEAASNSGEWAGYWSGFSTSSNSIVGTSSVAKYVSGSTNMYYYWNSPTDLSGFNALKMYTWYPNRYAYTYSVYFYDWNGRYKYYDCGGSYTYFHYYDVYYEGRWHLVNLPFHNSPNYQMSGFDESRIRYMRLYVYFYSGSTLNIDGLEFWQSNEAAGSSGPPALAESIPHGIYALDDGELKMQDSSFTSPEPWGAFVRSDNKLNISGSTFEGLWGTTHSAIKNEGQTYGGILAFDSQEVYLDDVTITKASSSGFYIENSNLYANNLDLSGISKDFPMAAGIIVAFQGTGIGRTHDVTIEHSEFHDSAQGSGIMVLSQDARGDADVTLHDVTAFKNGIYGVGIEIVGWSGNLSVDVTDSEFELNGASGFAFVAHDSKPTPKTQVSFNVDSSDSIENGGYGFLFSVEKADVNAKGVLNGLETFDNNGNGIGFEIKSMAGMLDLYFDSIHSYENLGNGMYISTNQVNFKDITGNTIGANGKLMIELDRCTFSSNEGNGVMEEHVSSSGYSDAIRPVSHVELVAHGLIVEKNEGHGYYVGARGNPQYGSRDGTYEFFDSLFSDNDNSGFYIRDRYYNYYERGYSEEHFLFDNCTFTYNNRGIEQYWDSGSYGTQTWVKIVDSTFQDNDYEAIRARSAWYSYYDTGQSYIQGAEYDVRETLLDGFVHIDIHGIHDQYGQVRPWASIIIVNNTYTSDEPMFLRTGMYMYSYRYPLDASVVYKNNKHVSPSTGNGVHIEMYGGTKLNGRVLIEDQDIYDPLGNGVYVRFGSSYQYQWERKVVSGQVRLVNVDIRNPLEDGIVIETWHRERTSASSSGFYSLLNTKVSGAATGIRSADFDGEIRNSMFTNLREATIYTYYGVIDVFESEIGEISETNLRVDEKGAVRLWFELRIKVVWRDEPDVFVDGTTVEIMDNSWNILGINSITSMEGVLFSNLNSYTVLPEGIFTKNPYIITADYIGIVKEVKTQIAANTEITIKLVDDISPRLTIESPRDGLEQREPTLEVKGTAYDKHTGIDRVEVSIDGQEWFDADMSSDKFTFSTTIEDVPEGLVLVRVRSYDMAGNMKEGAVSVLVDSTPPGLNVITPTNDMRTNKRTLEIVGTTDVGANVYINDQPIDIQYTLISHEVILAEGPNAIKVSSVDYLGNINEVVRYVTLDTQAPYIALVNVEDGTQVNTNMIHVDGTGRRGGRERSLPDRPHPLRGSQRHRGLRHRRSG
jgi:hypothetical protein